MNYTLEIEVLEYRNGELVASYAGLQECAYTHHVHPSMIKALLYTGNPLPSRVDSVTFDLSEESEFDIVRHPDLAGTRNEYELVPNALHTARGKKRAGGVAK